MKVSAQGPTGNTWKRIAGKAVSVLLEHVKIHA